MRWFLGGAGERETGPAVESRTEDKSRDQREAAS